MEGPIVLKIALGRLVMKCVKHAYSGLTFVKCSLMESREDVVTDHLVLAKDSVKILDDRR